MGRMLYEQLTLTLPIVLICIDLSRALLAFKYRDFLRSKRALRIANLAGAP